jgi:small subunit ribosomal protein S11
MNQTNKKLNLLINCCEKNSILKKQPSSLLFSFIKIESRGVKTIYSKSNKNSSLKEEKTSITNSSLTKINKLDGNRIGSINLIQNKYSHFLDFNLPTAHIQSTLNNTIITLTDSQGNTLYWSSAGSCDSHFKNSRKSTSYAAQVTAEQVARFCNTKMIQTINVKLKGIGYGKEASLKGFQLNGISIHKIEDVTTIPHNGCRLPKKRRI